MTTLYITRHGQTQWNVEKRMQGHKDSGLSPLGMQQARWLGERLDAVDLDVIISSSSGRTMRTSELIRGTRSLEIIPCDGLKEINLGQWEGMLHTDILSQYPVEYKNFWEAPQSYVPIGGESFSELLKRLLNTMDSILSEHDGKNVLLVTHAAALKAIFVNFEGKALKDFWSGPFIRETCLNIIEIDGSGVRVVLQGDTSHYQNAG